MSSLTLSASCHSLISLAGIHVLTAAHLGSTPSCQSRWTARAAPASALLPQLRDHGWLMSGLIPSLGVALNGRKTTGPQLCRFPGGSLRPATGQREVWSSGLFAITWANSERPHQSGTSCTAAWLLPLLVLLLLSQAVTLRALPRKALHTYLLLWVYFSWNSTFNTVCHFWHPQSLFFSTTIQSLSVACESVAPTSSPMSWLSLHHLGHKTRFHSAWA